MADRDRQTSEDKTSRITELMVAIAPVSNHASPQKSHQPKNSQDDLLRNISALGNLLVGADHLMIYPQAVDCLIDLIRHGSDIMLMSHCISVLSRIKAQASVSVIVDVLLATDIDLYENNRNPNYKVLDESLRLRSAAAQALGKLKDERAIIPLMSILNDKSLNYRLRLAAAESLGKLGDENAVTPLIDIINDERENSVYLKESAVKALGMLGDIRAIEPLIDMLESKKGLRNKFSFLKEQIIEAIARIGKPNHKATDHLLTALKDEAPSIRLAAVEALGEVGDESCVPLLSELIYDSHDDVAISAIAAIYNLAGERAIKDILTQDNLPQFLREELESYIP